MKILNRKYLALYAVIFLATLFVVFYRYIEYAYKAPERLPKPGEISDMSQEEIERNRKNNFFQNLFELKSHFAFSSTYQDYGAAKMRILPVVIISTMFLYFNLKNNLVKYNIGRNKLYQREKHRLQIKTALITPLFSLTVTITLLLIGLSSTHRNFSSPFFYFIYDHNDIIRLLMVNNIMAFIFIELFTLTGLFLLNLLVLSLIDRYGKFDALLMLIILTWLAPAVLLGNRFLETFYYLSPGSIMLLGSLHGYSLLQIIMPILFLMLTNIWIGKLNNDQLEI